jgi:aminoglycoside phosphotransferase (APT) family kinase protein
MRALAYAAALGQPTFALHVSPTTAEARPAGRRFSHHVRSEKKSFSSERAVVPAPGPRVRASRENMRARLASQSGIGWTGSEFHVHGGRMSVAESALPGIDAGRVQRWLAEHVDGLAGPVEFGLVSGGRSNLTYRLTDAAGVRYALRRPPTGGVLNTAHDVSREWRFISALAPTAVPVPPPVAYCADATVTGAEFYVMGFVEGLVLADRAAGLALAPPARPSAAEHLVDVLVALHALDPAVVGLGDMVRQTGYVERQLRRWRAQVHATGAPELPLLDEVHDLLARRVPAQSGGIVHGDYRAGNVAFGPDGAVRAVFDWELATTGDPMADLGWLASTWPDPGEQLPPTTPGPSTVAGFPARAQLVRRYARRSGRDVSNLPYWVAFSRWRSACIGVGVRARYLAGHMADDGFAAGLLTSAEPGAAGGRVVLAEAARDALRACPTDKE